MIAIWIGFFEVSGPSSNELLDGNAGAFLWIAAQAEDDAMLLTRVTNTMSGLGLTVVGAEQVQEVLDEGNIADAVAALLPEARLNVESVVCGTWHRFKNHDA